MKPSNQVFKTNDYNAFSYIKGNRSINKINLKRITNSCLLYTSDAADED